MDVEIASGSEDAYFKGQVGVEYRWSTICACLVGFYACAIPSSPKHSWNVFICDVMQWRIQKIGKGFSQEYQHIVCVSAQHKNSATTPPFAPKVLLDKHLRSLEIPIPTTSAIARIVCSCYIIVLVLYVYICVGTSPTNDARVR